MRVPRHVGFIPDGNRRWADGPGLPRAARYVAGIRPGLELLRCAEDAGVEEITAYGYTKENVPRPRDQVRAFKEACTELALLALEQGAALFVVGDTRSPRFPDPLRPFAASGSRALPIQPPRQLQLAVGSRTRARRCTETRFSGEPRARRGIGLCAYRTGGSRSLGGTAATVRLPAASVRVR